MGNQLQWPECFLGTTESSLKGKVSQGQLGGVSPQRVVTEQSLTVVRIKALSGGGWESEKMVPGKKEVESVHSLSPPGRQTGSSWDSACQTRANGDSSPVRRGSALLTADKLLSRHQCRHWIPVAFSHLHKLQRSLVRNSN